MNNTEAIFSLTCPYTENLFQGSYPKYVFVCSAGLLRSATAATVATPLGYNARACGSESYALIPLSANLIIWADKIVFVNEYNYLGALGTFIHDEHLSELIKEKAIIWDIEDEYYYNSPALVDKITELLLP